MLGKILSCLMVSCALVAPTRGQHGQERPRRVNPRVEQSVTPSTQPAAGSNLHVVDAVAGDTLRKISIREQVPLTELIRTNGIDPDEGLEEGREIRFYTSRPQETFKVFAYRTKHEDDTLAKIASRLRMPVEDLLQHNSFGPDEPLSVGEVVQVPFTRSSVEAVKQGSGSAGSRTTKGGVKRASGSGSGSIYIAQSIRRGTQSNSCSAPGATFPRQNGSLRS
jgi:LysM repeat protein